VSIKRSSSAKNCGRTSSKSASSSPNEALRKPDPPLLKAQKAAATREAVEVIQAFCGLSASEIEERLDIGRVKKSKKGGKSGELLNGYLRATEDSNTAGDEKLAELMFAAVKNGLLDPQKMIYMLMRPGIRRAIHPVRSLLLQLAIRGETRASRAEADRGYKQWCDAVRSHGKARGNERYNFGEWRDKAIRGLDEFLERLDSMSHYSWTVERKDRGTVHELNGRLTITSGRRSAQSVYAVDARIEITPQQASRELAAASSRQLLLGVVNGLTSSGHDINTLEGSEGKAEVKVSSRRTPSASEDFRERIQAIKSLIMDIGLDPRLEVDGDLPIFKDSPEEEAELKRQLSLFLDRPTLPPEEAEVWLAAQRSYQEQIDAEVMKRSPEMDCNLPLARPSHADPVLAFLESIPPDLPTVTLAQARAWTARRQAEPDEPKPIIPS
jgi:hypothetical protein